MKKLKHTGVLLILLIASTVIHAQGSKGSDFDKLMRSNGRIYVVIAVMLTILAGLIIYLIRLDRKIGKLEKDN